MFDHRNRSWKLILVVLPVLIKVFLLLNIQLGIQEHLYLYRAWTLVKFGRDETGNFLPPIFQSHESYQLPFLSYLIVPVVGVLGLNFFSGAIVEMGLWAGLALLLLHKFKGIGAPLMVLVGPIFVWPGSWEAKLLVVELMLWFIFLERRRWIALTGIGVLMLLTSFDSYVLLPTLILGAGVAFPTLRKGLFTPGVCLILLVTSLMFQARRFPGLGRAFREKEFGVFLGSEVSSTINLLRGEDLRANVQVWARVWHNKLSYGTVFINNFLTATDPVLFFGHGDLDKRSNSQWVGILLVVYLPMLVLVVRFWKMSYAWWVYVFVVGIVIASLKGTQVFERDMFIAALCLVIIIAGVMDRFPLWGYRVQVGATMLLLFAVYFSANFHPLNMEIESGYGLKNIASLALAHPNTLVLFADDVYANPGPTLAYYMKPVPLKNKLSVFGYRQFLRRVGNIEVVTPNDKRLELEREMCRKVDLAPIRIVSANAVNGWSDYRLAVVKPIIVQRSGIPLVYSAVYNEK